MNSQANDRLMGRFSEWIREVPAEELRHNARAWFAARLTELDLVSRQEYDQQVAALRRAEARLAELERLVGELEGARAP